MIIKKYDNLYCIRLMHKEVFLEKLEQFAVETELKNAFIINGVGMLKDSEIGYFKDGKYIKSVVRKPVELISVNGNMFINPEGKNEWHIHVALARESHNMVGGHLLGGLVWNTAEIFVYVIAKAKFIKELEDKNLRLNFK